MQSEFKTRTFILQDQRQVDGLMNLIPNLPRDGSIRVRIEKNTKERTPTQNERMWAGALRDIAEQAWVHGRQYDADTWHEHFKATYLPEDDDPELARLVARPEKYHKWKMTPSGRRLLIGSTSQLSRYGMARYMQQIEAFGSSLGVEFSEPPNRAYENIR